MLRITAGLGLLSFRLPPPLSCSHCSSTASAPPLSPLLPLLPPSIPSLPACLPLFLLVFPTSLATLRWQAVVDWCWLLVSQKRCLSVTRDCTHTQTYAHTHTHSGAATGGYVLLYAVYYFFAKTQMCARTHTLICSYTRTCTHTHAHAHTHAHTRTRTSAHARVHMHTRTRTQAHSQAHARAHA